MLPVLLGVQWRGSGSEARKQIPPCKYSLSYYKTTYNKLFIAFNAFLLLLWCFSCCAVFLMAHHANQISSNKNRTPANPSIEECSGIGAEDWRWDLRNSSRAPSSVPQSPVSSQNDSAETRRVTLPPPTLEGLTPPAPCASQVNQIPTRSSLLLSHPTLPQRVQSTTRTDLHAFHQMCFR